MPAADPHRTRHLPARASHAPAGSARRPRRRAASEFYAPALDQADRDTLADAGAVAGLDQEIAVLRLRLRRLLAERPDDFPLVIRTIELLVRAVGAAAKVSADDPGGMLDRVTSELGGVLALLSDEESQS